jgi:hypothetical protein
MRRRSALPLRSYKMRKVAFREFVIVMLWMLAVIAGIVGLSTILGDVSPLVSTLLWLGAALLFAFPIVLFVAIIPNMQPPWIRRVQSTGTTAPAEVLANDLMKGVGGYEGGDRYVDLPVRVNADPPFETKLTCRLSQAMMLKPGSQVRVKYDPAHHRHVILTASPIPGVAFKP